MVVLQEVYLKLPNRLALDSCSKEIVLKESDKIKSKAASVIRNNNNFSKINCRIFYENRIVKTEDCQVLLIHMYFLKNGIEFYLYWIYFSRVNELIRDL